MRSRLNSILTGCFLGLVVPVLGVMLFYLLRYRSVMSAEQFVNSIFVLKVYTHVMALGVYIGNLALFFLFMKIDFFRAARGILLATILYTFLIVVFRLGL